MDQEPHSKKRGFEDTIDTPPSTPLDKKPKLGSFPPGGTKSSSGGGGVVGSEDGSIPQPFTYQEKDRVSTRYKECHVYWKCKVQVTDGKDAYTIPIRQYLHMIPLNRLRKQILQEGIAWRPIHVKWLIKNVHATSDVKIGDSQLPHELNKLSMRMLNHNVLTPTLDNPYQEPEKAMDQIYAIRQGTLIDNNLASPPKAPEFFYSLAESQTYNPRPHQMIQPNDPLWSKKPYSMSVLYHDQWRAKCNLWRPLFEFTANPICTMTMMPMGINEKPADFRKGEYAVFYNGKCLVNTPFDYGHGEIARSANHGDNPFNGEYNAYDNPEDFHKTADPKFYDQFNVIKDYDYQPTMEQFKMTKTMDWKPTLANQFRNTGYMSAPFFSSNTIKDPVFGFERYKTGDTNLPYTVHFEVEVIYGMEYLCGDMNYLTDAGEDQNVTKFRMNYNQIPYMPVTKTKKIKLRYMDKGKWNEEVRRYYHPMGVWPFYRAYKTFIPIEYVT